MMEQKNLPQNHPRVITVVGSLASGKDVLAKYLIDRYQAVAIEVGEYARLLSEEAENENEPHLQYDVSAKDLVDFGTEYIIQRLVSESIEAEEASRKIIVITGVRTPAEAAFLKAHFGSDLLLVYVRVGDQRERYERVQERNLPTDASDFKGFVEQDEKLKVDNALEGTAGLADITLYNNGSLESYFHQIDDIIGPYITEKNG